MLQEIQYKRDCMESKLFSSKSFAKDVEGFPNFQPEDLL